MDDFLQSVSRDAYDKPCEVNPEGGKLGGHAVQNWPLLRMLPVLKGDKIEDPGDNTVCPSSRFQLIS